jgi:hypothetical protein
MMPRVGQKYEIEMVAASKSREEYNSEEYARTKLPVAPAIRIDDETIVERADISEEKLEEIIRTKLGLGAVVA